MVAHVGCTLGGGLKGLRKVFASEGVSEPLWYEVSDIRTTSETALRAKREGADLVFVWGEATVPCSAASMVSPTPEAP